MLAAVLHSASGAPRAETFPDPTPAPGEVVVRVLAAGLHPLVRGHATATHYSSHGQYPMIPGVDGVAELPDGRRAYIGWLRPPYGTFAERAAIPAQPVIALPDGLAPELGAAIVNPAMSSWLALRVRAHMEAGARVLILGATGASGQLAVQVARTLGAGHVVAAGRNQAVLDTLAADAILRVDAPDFPDEVARAIAAGVDLVLDYLWGAPAEATFAALAAGRKALAGRRVRYVNIGQMAGDRAHLSPHLLRSMPIEVLGSGLGSVSAPEMAREFPAILAAAARGALTIAIDPVPLAQVGDAWTRPADGGRRVVMTI